MNLRVVPLLHLLSAASLVGIATTTYEFWANRPDFRAEMRHVAKELKALRPNRPSGPAGWDYSVKDFFDQFELEGFPIPSDKGRHVFSA